MGSGPIERCLYPNVDVKFESEHLKVQCPVCGERGFYRFIRAENQDWMCLNPDCDMVLTTTEEMKRDPGCGKTDCVAFDDVLFPCFECIDCPDCQKPWHASFYEKRVDG